MIPAAPAEPGVYVLCRCVHRSCGTEAWVAGDSVPANHLPRCPGCPSCMYAVRPLCFLHVDPVQAAQRAVRAEGTGRYRRP